MEEKMTDYIEARANLKRKKKFEGETILKN